MTVQRYFLASLLIVPICCFFGALNKLPYFGESEKRENNGIEEVALAVVEQRGEILERFVTFESGNFSDCDFEYFFEFIYFWPCCHQIFN